MKKPRACLSCPMARRYTPRGCRSSWRSRCRDLDRDIHPGDNADSMGCRYARLPFTERLPKPMAVELL